MGIWKNAQMSIPAEAQSQCGDFVLMVRSLKQFILKICRLAAVNRHHRYHYLRLKTSTSSPVDFKGNLKCQCYFVLLRKSIFSMVGTLKSYTLEDGKVARYAKALGHPARIVILRFLDKQCSCFAGNIAEQLPIAASTVSQHLNELKEAGLIQGTVTPPTIKYCINRTNWAEAKELLYSLFEGESFQERSDNEMLNTYS
jgi:DNA-binding HxlR family transcriptional regulator